MRPMSVFYPEPSSQASSQLVAATITEPASSNKHCSCAVLSKSDVFIESAYVASRGQELSEPPEECGGGRRGRQPGKQAELRGMWDTP